MKKITSFVISFIVAALTLAPCASPAAEGLPFEDVPEKAWFHDTVAEAYEKGIVSGRSAAVFAPNDNVTRAEVAAMLARTDGADVSGYGDNASAFSDVKSGAWYVGYVGWAAAENILRGYPDGTVRPGAEVTRAELSAMIARYTEKTGASLPADPRTDSFTDAASFKSWFADAAEEMRIAGLLRGYTNGEMSPSSPATRAEVATIFVRLSHALDTAESTALFASKYVNTKTVLIYDDEYEDGGTRRYDTFVGGLSDVIAAETDYKIRPYTDSLTRRKKEIVLPCSREESADLCDGIGPMEFRLRVISDETGDSLLIGYSNYFTYGNAVRCLLENYFRNGELRVPKNLDYSETARGLYEGRDYTLIESGVNMLRDPFVLVEDGVYYMYGTWWVMYKNTSGDLAGPWEGPYQVAETPADFETDKWAPEVYKYNGKYWMFASYRPQGPDLDGVVILSSDSPEGPFRMVTDGTITPRDKECIDASFYVDKNGDPWLVFCLSFSSPGSDSVGRICAARLSDDLTELVTEPVVIFSMEASPWSSPAQACLCEGPFLYRLGDGSLIGIWAGLDGCGYAVGVVRSDNGDITGNWIHDELPLYSQYLTGQYDGGHGMIFRGLDGELYLTVHAPNIWDASYIGPDGRGAMPIFIRLREQNGTVVWDMSDEE